MLDDRLDDISKAAGLPYENVLNLVFAVQRQVLVHTLGPYRGEYAAMLWTTDPETKSGEYYDLLYRAMNNSPEEYRAVYKEMADSGYFPEDKIKNAMEQRMMKAQGVDVVFDSWEGLGHAFATDAGQYPEADEACRRAFEYLKGRLSL